MQMRLSIRRRALTALVLSLLMASVARPGQRAESSLTELDVENSELKIALETVLGENKQLRDAISAAESSLAQMRKALATNSGESEVFRRQAMELKKRFEALGIHTAGDSKKLEQRLLTAVNELQQAENEKKRRTEALVRLSEAVLQFSKTASPADVDARLILEAEVRNANDALGVEAGGAVEGRPISSTLTDAAVISVKNELALVVIDLGRKQGIKVGMPFQVIRENAFVGVVRVVEVRETFCGAVIQHLNSESNPAKVGDRLKIDIQP